MEIIEGGQLSNEELLKRVVRDRVRADSRYKPMNGLGVVMHGNVVEVMEDQAHLAVEARIPLQISCRLCETGIIVATFPSPRIVPPSKRSWRLRTPSTLPPWESAGSSWTTWTSHS